jgi:hypothetical protein
LRSVADQHTTVGCPVWDIWENYTTETKANLQNFAMAQMDSLQVIFNNPQGSRIKSLTPLAHRTSNGSFGLGK